MTDPRLAAAIRQGAILRKKAEERAKTVRTVADSDRAKTERNARAKLKRRWVINGEIFTLIRQAEAGGLDRVEIEDGVRDLATLLQRSARSKGDARNLSMAAVRRLRRDRWLKGHGHVEQEVTEPIRYFNGEYHWLSNFWSCFIVLDGQTYPSTENAYQAAKTLVPELRTPFRSCFASKAKEMGRALPLRPDWEEVKLSVMEDVLRQKFSSAELRDRLLATGTAELIEGNTWADTYWGRDDKLGGQNNLGKLLMRIREGLRR